MKMNRNVFDNAIKKENCFVHGEYKICDAFNVAFAVSSNFIRPLGVAMTSILETNNLTKIGVHIFINKIDEPELSRLNEFARKYKCIICIYQIDDSIFDNLNSGEFTKATYYRFFIPFKLYGMVEKVLYLDADVCCLKSLEVFKKIDLGNNVACVVRDQKILKIEGKWTVKETYDDYFNAGIMYIDIPAWQRADISAKCLDWLSDHSYEVRCVDQDALNVVLKNRVVLLDRKYNYMCDLSNTYYKNICELPNDTIIVHFVGFNKPWHLWCVYALAGYFRKYSEISLWNDVPLDNEPVKYRQMRMLAGYYLKKRKIFKAIYWLYKSCTAKFK